MAEREPPLVRELADSVVVITGGTAGIGLACAKAFAQAGVKSLTLLGRNAERAQRARAALAEIAPDVPVAFVETDAQDRASAAAAVGQIRAQAGRIDVLVNSANGSSLPQLLLQTPVEDCEEAFVSHARPAILMTRLVLPIMREQHGGCVINVASDAAKTATPGETLVGAGMAAVVMFTRSAALEAKRDGIRLNAITPSLVADTEGTARLFEDPFASKLFGKASQLAHLGVATAADQGALAVFLASPAGARLTGQAISINGGISAA